MPAPGVAPDRNHSPSTTDAMAKHPGSRRVHQDAETEDAFIARMVEYGEWARRHSRAVTIGGILLLVVLAAGLYYVNHRASLESTATARLTELRQTVQSGNTALAIQDLESFLATFPGTDAADEARVLLGEVYLREGRYQEAIRAVEPMADDPGEPLGAAAAFLLAAAHEQADEPQRAESVYLEIADEAAMPHQRRRAMADAARIRMQADDPAGAAQLYGRLVQDLEEGDPQRALYEMRRAEAEAMTAAQQQTS